MQEHLQKLMEHQAYLLDKLRDWATQFDEMARLAVDMGHQINRLSTLVEAHQDEPAPEVAPGPCASPTTRTFARDYLMDELDLPGGKNQIHSEMFARTRWSICYEIVFRTPELPAGYGWFTGYSVGATESQDETPWQYEDKVECTLVRLSRKTVPDWVPAVLPPSVSIAAEMAVHAPSEIPPTGPSITESKFAANEHDYPGIVAGKFVRTSNCANGCGAWMGGSRSGGPKGVDPFGECPTASQDDAPHTAEFAPDHESTVDNDGPRPYDTMHHAPTPPDIPGGAVMVRSDDLDKPLPHIGGRKKTEYTAREWAYSGHFLNYMKKHPFKSWPVEQQNMMRDRFVDEQPSDLKMNRWGERFSKFCGVV